MKINFIIGSIRKNNLTLVLIHCLLAVYTALVFIVADS